MQFLLLEIDEQSTWRLREARLRRSNNAHEHVSTVRHSIAGLSEQYPMPGVTGLFVGGDVGYTCKALDYIGKFGQRNNIEEQ